jgi:hypothetical protein
MLYDKQILQIFTEVGSRGISARLLAKHVYNMNCTLFEQPDIQQVVKEVKSFILRKSLSKRPILEHTGRWGYYRLNKRGIAYARQQMMEANETAADDANGDDPPLVDMSLNLFPD